MTDKQIIIDGVDVSGCEFYWQEKALCNNGNLVSDCQENKDCLYKKYKRKEQKLKNIEEFRHNYCMNCEDLLNPSHSCKGCNMVELKRIIEGKENE